MFALILQIAIPFVCLGFVCAISFMEAPLKFQAPNITIPLGLGIGYLVFHTFNKVEIVLGISLLVSIFAVKPQGKFSSIETVCNNGKINLTIEENKVLNQKKYY